jgi:hypothetical protein
VALNLFNLVFWRNTFYTNFNSQKPDLQNKNIDFLSEFLFAETRIDGEIEKIKNKLKFLEFLVAFIGSHTGHIGLRNRELNTKADSYFINNKQSSIDNNNSYFEISQKFIHIFISNLVTDKNENCSYEALNKDNFDISFNIVATDNSRCIQSNKLNELFSSYLTYSLYNKFPFIKNSNAIANIDSSIILNLNPPISCNSIANDYFIHCLILSSGDEDGSMQNDFNNYKLMIKSLDFSFYNSENQYIKWFERMLSEIKKALEDANNSSQQNQSIPVGASISVGNFDNPHQNPVNLEVGTVSPKINFIEVNEPNFSTLTNNINTVTNISPLTPNNNNLNNNQKLKINFANELSKITKYLEQIFSKLESSSFGLILVKNKFDREQLNKKILKVFFLN